MELELKLFIDDEVRAEQAKDWSGEKLMLSPLGLYMVLVFVLVYFAHNLLTTLLGK